MFLAVFKLAICSSRQNTQQFLSHHTKYTADAISSARLESLLTTNIRFSFTTAKIASITRI